MRLSRWPEVRDDPAAAAASRGVGSATDGRRHRATGRPGASALSAFRRDREQRAAARSMETRGGVAFDPPRALQGSWLHLDLERRRDGCWRGAPDRIAARGPRLLAADGDE